VDGLWGFKYPRSIGFDFAMPIPYNPSSYWTLLAGVGVNNDSA
jgi:hypothetical protein